jgi:hypothetical protein
MMQVLGELARDAAGLAGACLLSYGAWLVYPPAGFIAGGALLIAGAWLSARGA